MSGGHNKYQGTKKPFSHEESYPQLSIGTTPLHINLQDLTEEERIAADKAARKSDIRTSTTYTDLSPVASPRNLSPAPTDTESFSMSGSPASPSSLSPLAERHTSMLEIDEPEAKKHAPLSQEEFLKHNIIPQRPITKPPLNPNEEALKKATEEAFAMMDLSKTTPVKQEATLPTTPPTKPATWLTKITQRIKGKNIVETVPAPAKQSISDSPPLEETKKNENATTPIKTEEYKAKDPNTPPRPDYAPPLNPDELSLLEQASLAEAKKRLGFEREKNSSDNLAPLPIENNNNVVIDTNSNAEPVASNKNKYGTREMEAVILENMPNNPPASAEKNENAISATDPHAGLVTPETKRKSPKADEHDHPIFSKDQLVMPMNSLAVRYGKASEHYTSAHIIKPADKYLTEKELAEFEKKGITPQYIAGTKAPKPSHLYQDAPNDPLYKTQFKLPKQKATLETETVVVTTEEVPMIERLYKLAGIPLPVKDQGPSATTMARLVDVMEPLEGSTTLNQAQNKSVGGGMEPIFETSSYSKNQTSTSVPLNDPGAEKNAAISPFTWLGMVVKSQRAANALRKDSDQDKNTFKNRRAKFTETLNELKAAKQQAPHDNSSSRGRD